MFPRALIDLHCDTLTALSPEDAPQIGRASCRERV